MKHPARALLIGVAILSLAIGPSEASVRASGKTTLTVFAASSLAQTFMILGKEFQAKHPGITVQFSFLASPTLAAQMQAGAPADVFASASTADMKSAEAIVPNPILFTSNRVVLATPRDNRFHINKIVDLNKRGVKWIQCAHIVPCGVAADSALTSDGRVATKPVSLEPKVSSVVAKLVSGEVDAAIIYHTDYLANKRVLREVRFKPTEGAITHYPIGVLKSSSNQELAKSFVDTVLSAFGRKVMAEAGFGGAK